MTAFENFVHNCLQIRTENIPQPYGTWHIVCALLTIALTVCMVLFFRNISDGKMRAIVFAFWFIMVFFEVGKQLLFAMHCDGVTATWRYDWYSFPFQFCSTPFYTLPFVFLLKDGKVRRAIMAYISTFSLFAGIIVMILPTSVFGPYFFINTQTMVHHGAQIVLGVWMASYNRQHLGKRFFAWAMMVFGGFVAVAMALNVFMPKYLAAKGIETAFNMFFLSPYYNNDVPVLSTVWPILPYPVYLIIYIIGFAFVAALVYAIEKGIVALTRPRKS